MRALSLLLVLGAADCATDTTASEARRLVAAGARLLDVRTRAEFAERHVPGSLNIPVEELRLRLPELGARDRPLIVYCHTGVRAGAATIVLRKAGFSAVHNLGSIGRWYTGSDGPAPDPF